MYQRLYALHRLDAITVANLDGALDIDMASMNEPEAEAEAASLQQLLDSARGFIAKGNHRSALNAARKANELAASAETQALISQIETAWLQLLRGSLTATKRIPSLKVPPSKLRGLPLTAPERYLLSRFDGKRDLGSVINVSPIRELEALSHFQRFLEMGLVGLD
jgi:hypothetical protein